MPEINRDINKAIIFSFKGEDYHKAHLLEHCLSAYFLDHNLPLYKLRMLSLGLGVLFDEKVPPFPKVSDLEPYIENQKRRVNIELLTALDSRDILIERLHKSRVETLEEATDYIENILNWDNREVLQDFKRIYKTKVEVANLSATLSEIPKDTGFSPTKRRIRVPKTDPHMDTVEIAIRVPRSVEVLNWWVSLYSRAEKELEKLTILGDIAHGFFYSIHTLPEGYHYFSHSPRTRVGQGQRAIDFLLDFLRNRGLEEHSSFNRKREMILERISKNWKKNKLTDMLVTELILWRRILKPEDFESLSYKRMVELHQTLLFDPNNIYILTDF